MTRNRGGSWTSYKGAQDGASAFVRKFLTEVESTGKLGLMHGKVLAIERDRYNIGRHDDRRRMRYTGNEGLGVGWWTDSEQYVSRIRVRLLRVGNSMV